MGEEYSSLVDAIGLAVNEHESIGKKRFRQLKNSASLGMMDIFRDHQDRTIGFIAWAMVSKESILHYIKTGVILKYPYEWNEGNIVYLVDIQFKNGSGLYCSRKLREFIRKNKIVAFTKNGKLKILIRTSGKLKNENRIFKVGAKQ